MSLGVGMDVGVEGGAAVAASGGAAPGVEWLAARLAVSWVPAPCVGAGPSVAVVPACSPVGLVGAEGELEELRAEDDSDGDGVVFGARLRRREARLAAQAALARWREARTGGVDVVEGALAVQARAAVAAYRVASDDYDASEAELAPRQVSTLRFAPAAVFGAGAQGTQGEALAVQAWVDALPSRPWEEWRPGGAAGVEARASGRRAAAERPPSEVSSGSLSADGCAVERPRLPGRRPSAKQLRGGASRAEARAAVREGRAPMEAVLRALE